MTKAKPKKAPDEDEAQSLRFMEEAEKATVDGGLSPTEVEAEFEGTFRRVASVPRPQRE